eukprot:1504599-Rhodomonas_salina.1
MSGTDLGSERCAVLRKRMVPLCYAMSGTDLGSALQCKRGRCAYKKGDRALYYDKRSGTTKEVEIVYVVRYLPTRDLSHPRY